MSPNVPPAKLFDEMDSLEKINHVKKMMEYAQEHCKKENIYHADILDIVGWPWGEWMIESLEHSRTTILKAIEVLYDESNLGSPRLAQTILINWALKMGDKKG